MTTRCTSSNRELILHILQSEAQEPVVYHPAPDFACSVGEYTLHRDGTLTAQEDALAVFPLLAALQLCDCPVQTVPRAPAPFTYPMQGHSGKSLLNLFSIVSSRQVLLNKALAAPKAFFVLPSLMDDLLAHPPVTVPEFLQALYRRDQEYGGIRLDAETVELYGFRRGKPEEADIHRQLADVIMDTALSLNWVKPYTKNVRNRKFAFRVWLNAIGMSGPEYERARQVMLSRLYGRTDRRGLRQ